MYYARFLRKHAREVLGVLDEAMKVLAPELVEERPKEPKARLAYYAEFLQRRGAALLAGKRSAWGKLR